jgi:hypothetical protein
MAIIDKPDLYFNTKLYTGNNNTTQTISGVGFQPDLVWIKNRDNVEIHYLFDAVRGSGKILSSSYSSAEADLPVNTKPTIASDGFTLTSNGSNDELNFGTRTYVSWNWKAGGTASSNTSGSITSTVSANTTSGFSIVNWTNSTSSVQTIGHGLGAVPKMIIMKVTGATGSWNTYHNSIGNTHGLFLNSTASSEDNSAFWNDTSPTSTVFTTGTNGNLINNTLVAYCFAEKQGYSKFGSYTGNGSATDGTFIYTGFKPAFLMIKATDAVKSWMLLDNKRNPSGLSGANSVDYRLRADTDEATSDNAGGHDFYSNGFKHYSTDTSTNQNGTNYIYMAIAENPFVTSTGVPATAR